MLTLIPDPYRVIARQDMWVIRNARHVLRQHYFTYEAAQKQAQSLNGYLQRS